jgi:putative transposase
VAVPKLTLDEVVRHGNWVEFVNEPMTEAEAEAIRLCIRRNRPFGSDAWTRATAVRLGLQSSIRDRGGEHQPETEII